MGNHWQNHGNKMKIWEHMAVGQNLVPLVNIKIAGKWMFIPLKMVCIGIDPYPHGKTSTRQHGRCDQSWRCPDHKDTCCAWHGLPHVFRQETTEFSAFCVKVVHPFMANHLLTILPKVYPDWNDDL